MKKFFAEVSSQIKPAHIIILATVVLLAAVYNINTSEGTSTLDMMEYTSDGGIQAAYVSNAVSSATGGTITTSGGYTIHAFTGSGTFYTSVPVSVEYLIVAGGGSGSGAQECGEGCVVGGAGGGAGGMLEGTSSISSGSYSIIVGGGGQNSSFNGLTAVAGGGGLGGSGGSGGGGGALSNFTGGAGTAGQGNNGGNGAYADSGGGGGGKNGAGGNAPYNSGGAGKSSSITGSAVTYAYGGSGGGFVDGTLYPGAAGGANTGGGGGGGKYKANGSISGGGAGGSGIVVVRYLSLPYLQSYYEPTIRTQGSYALKGVANVITSLNRSLTRTISSPIDLSNKTSVTFDLRASRTGSNIKIGLHDSGGTTTEVTPNVASANVFQSVSVDLSGVTNVNKDAIDQIIITIVNADAANTFYLDNMTAFPLDGLVCTQNTVSSIVSNNRYSEGNASARFLIGLDEGGSDTNITVLEAQSCIMSLNNNETLVAGSINLTGGSIALAEGAQIKVGQPVWVIDADGDGYSADGKLYYGAQPAGGIRKNVAANIASVDCNDSNISLYRTVAGYFDSDGDGYGAGTYITCAGPTGSYVANNTDCYDANANAKPGSTYCSATNRGDGSYDYNCSSSNTTCGTAYYGVNDIPYRSCRTNGCVHRSEEPSIACIGSAVGCGATGYANSGSQGLYLNCASCSGSPATYCYTRGASGTQACQ